MPIVAESIKTLRSFGGNLAIVTQTIPALDEIYGRYASGYDGLEVVKILEAADISIKNKGHLIELASMDKIHDLETAKRILDQRKVAQTA